jgi:hypothetical protein
VLTFLPPVLALFMLGWVGLPFYVLILLVALFCFRQIHGVNWLARADHHAGADGQWLAGGCRTWSGLLKSWSAQPLACLIVVICLAVVLWRGSVLPESHDMGGSVVSQSLGKSLGEVGLKEMVAALERPIDEKNLEEKLGLLKEEGLQQGEGGEKGSQWSLQSWSRRRPFGEVE